MRKRVAVLMAGGSGERFWPISRRVRPKQLLPLISEKPLIVEAVERIRGYIPPEDIFIFTNELIKKSIEKIINQVPPENIIAEPFKRNTAPCLALASAFFLAKFNNRYEPKEIAIGVFTSDHRIYPKEDFLKTVDIAYDFVEKNYAIVTIGIPPLRPDTGFGYIESSKEAVPHFPNVYKVLKFHEKPSPELANEYVHSGNFFWNSGMFFWNLETFIKELNQNAYEIANKIPNLRMGFDGLTDKVFEGVNPNIVEIYSTMPDISIDYALMEKTRSAYVVRSLFQWDDIGSWDSLERTKPKDENGNVSLGNNILIDTRDSIVVNNSDSGKIIVSLLGVKDFVVIVDNDAVLVCPKNKVQNVKEIINKIKQMPNGEQWT